MQKARFHTYGRGWRTIRQGGDIPKLNTLHLEIENLFIHPRPGSGLIAGTDFQWKNTRCYTCEFSGDQTVAEEFLRGLLLNPQAEQMHVNAAPAIVQHLCFIDVRIRQDHLSLEREYILRYCRHLTVAQEGFAPSKPDLSVAGILDIKPHQRIYFLNGSLPDMDRILRHLVNPVIHDWEVIYA